jgi:hypothetical protein
VLRGTLAAIGLPALLTMLEQERMTGRLALNGNDTGWIDIVKGRIVGCSCSTPGADLVATLMSLLSWKQGTFELSPMVPPPSEAMLSVTQVLLEHARRHDEASRPRRIAYA